MFDRMRSFLRLGTAVGIVFVITQIVIPGVMLLEPRPARFSWQMYAGVRTQSEFVIVRQDGVEQDVDVRDYVAHPRLEMDFSENLPAFICETEPDVLHVRVEPMLDGETRIVPCGR